jgi:ABC-type multidrug transport system ATPase subunit
MVSLQLDDIGKRYKWEWIFKNLNYHFAQGTTYAVEGKNGAGKSTFLQILSGFLSPTLGKVYTSFDGKRIEREQVYQLTALAAPYSALIEDFTLLEAVRFQQNFKAWQHNINAQNVIDELNFTKNNLQKPLKYFSSGMRQRVKLALAILSDAPLLLLDEPTITLDTQGMQWFYELLGKYNQVHSPNPKEMGTRTTIIASNVESDFQTCTQRLNLLDYK